MEKSRGAAPADAGWGRAAMRPRRIWANVATLVCGSIGCANWEGPAPVSPGAGGFATGSVATVASGGSNCAVTMGPRGGSSGPTGYPRGLHAAGNKLVDASGIPITIRGVNRSGTEYQCVKGTGIFDGPSDDASVRAMASWNVNAVRVPLNESCWLGINGAPEHLSGSDYQSVIKAYVALLHKYALIPILELHWAGPGDELATVQLPLPSADHSLDFWRGVATVFLDDDGVVFEPFNEPFPDSNRDSDAAWSCWRDGCFIVAPRDQTGRVHQDYQAAGMARLVETIRDTGATQLILLGGVQFSNAMTQWLTHKPDDPKANLGAAWHVYNYNLCSNMNCWQGVPAQVAAAVPLVATEIGQSDCDGSFITPLMEFLDGQGAGYLAWAWNAYGSCVPAAQGVSGQPYSLITDYNCPLPNSGFAQTFYDHLNVNAI